MASKLNFTLFFTGSKKKEINRHNLLYILVG
jgi:hypothetical protein